MRCMCNDRTVGAKTLWKGREHDSCNSEHLQCDVDLGHGS